MLTPMRRLGLVLAVLYAVVGSGWSQSQPQQSIEEASVNLLQLKQVQDELKFTAAQRTSFQRELQGFQRQAQQIFSKAPANEQERQAGLRRARTLQVQTGRKLLGMLTQPQKARLRQLGLQLFGLFTLRSPEIANQLKLTAAQKKVVTDAQQALQKKVQDRAQKLESQRQAAIRRIPQPKSEQDQQGIERYRRQVSTLIANYQREDARAFEQMRRESEAMISRALTAQQRAQWTQMKGAPFKFPSGVGAGA